MQSARHPPADRSRARAAVRARGFSFIELIVVMGAMAMLMGLAVGYLSNVGQATLLTQARSILSETAYRCVNGSTGGRRALLTLRRGEDEEGLPILMIGAALARPVVTHQMETLDFASGARMPSVNGPVELVRGGGRVGNSAKFTGGHLYFAPQAIYAMTDGLELDVWLKPNPRNRMMSVVRGEDSYEVLLVQTGESDTYDVRLQLNLRLVSEGRRAVPAQKVYETSGGPLVANGRWTRLQVEFDGLGASIRVNGLEVYQSDEIQRRPGDALVREELAQVHRIAVGRMGALALTISSGQSPFYGEMDSLQLRGVFRTEELERELPGSLEVISPPLPLRIVYANGGLDPDVHNRDQVLRFRDASTPEDPPLRLTLGMYGTVSARYEKLGERGTDTKPKPTPAPRRDPARAVPGEEPK